MTKVLFLGLVFYTGSFTMRTLLSLPDHFDVVLLECYSEESDNIAEKLLDLSKHWKGNFRHVRYSKNIIANVYRKFLRENEKVLSDYDVIITSDMDVEFEKNLLWEHFCDLLTTIPKIGVLSFLCSDRNHQPQNGGFGSISYQNVQTATNGVKYGLPQNGKHTGWQCVMFPSHIAKDFFVDSTETIIDEVLGLWLQKKDLQWFVLVEHPVLHLMWDAYNEIDAQEEDVQRYIHFKEKRKQKVRTGFWQGDTSDCELIFDNTYHTRN